MIRKKTNRKKFEYYLKYCKKCEELFKAESKLSNYCETCKEKINKERIENILKSKGLKK